MLSLYETNTCPPDPLKDPDYWDGGEENELEQAKLKTYVENADGNRRRVLPEFVRAKLRVEGNEAADEVEEYRHYYPDADRSRRKLHADQR